MPAYEAMQNAIIDGNADIALALTNAAIAEGAPAREILDTGLLPGMDEVGRRMKAGDCFIPEVLLSARTMQTCLDVLKPHLAAGESILARRHRHRHGRGRRARHRQEPRRHAARGRRLRGAQPRHRHHRRRLREGGRRSTTPTSSA